MSDDARIAAIVTIKTELPPEFGSFVTKPGLVSLINHMATLGAVTQGNGRFFVGSRLTVYEGENAWSVQFGLVLFLPLRSVLDNIQNSHAGKTQAPRRHIHLG